MLRILRSNIEDIQPIPQFKGVMERRRCHDRTQYTLQCVAVCCSVLQCVAMC